MQIRPLIPQRKSFMSRAWPLACLLCLLISGVPAVISAADPFPQTMDIAGKTLKKNGEALCEWGIFGLDLYRVAMWVETPSSDAEKLLQQNQVRCIELFFLRSLSQKQMRKAYRESMRANQPADDEAMNESIEKFLNTVQAAAKGSRMRLVCLPDWGVIVQQGDKKTLIHGKRPFNDLIMKMYIGKRPPTPAVAKGLLGNHPNVITDTGDGTAEAGEKLRKVPTPDAPPR